MAFLMVAFLISSPRRLGRCPLILLPFLVLVLVLMDRNMLLLLRTCKSMLGFVIGRRRHFDALRILPCLTMGISVTNRCVVLKIPFIVAGLFLFFSLLR